MQPTKFKPYYIISAFSKKLNRLQEQYITTEMKMGKRCNDLTTARNRAVSFAASLNESKLHGVKDWTPALYLQASSTKKFVVPVSELVN